MKSNFGLSVYNKSQEVGITQAVHYSNNYIYLQYMNENFLFYIIMNDTERPNPIEISLKNT